MSIQHFGLARELGLETVGFPMMSHTISPEKLAAQARIMADAGCQCVYVVDSAGALVLEGVADRNLAALVAELGDDAQVGFMGTRISAWAWPTRSKPSARVPSRSTGPAAGSAMPGGRQRAGRGAGQGVRQDRRQTGIDFFEIAATPPGRLSRPPCRQSACWTATHW